MIWLAKSAKNFRKSPPLTPYIPLGFLWKYQLSFDPSGSQTEQSLSRWKTVHDSRVRDCHQSFDGKIFSWDDPPEIWYKTKTRGIVHTGRRCHPGEDYCCRCAAIPVFDINTINVPMEKAVKTKG